MGRDILRDFTIPFIGLKEGRNVFKFDIDDSFFAKFEGGDQIHGADIHVELVLDKKLSFLELDFFVEGSIDAVCDRCNNEFRQELLDEHKVYVKFHDEAATLEEEEDVVYLPTGDAQINVAKLIFEFVILSLPLQYICPPKADGTSGCNEKVIKILEGQQPDQQIDKEEDETTDPRWSALKKLK